MKNAINLIVVLCVIVLTACSNKAALKDSSTEDYKTAKEAPELILPSTLNKSSNKNSDKKTKRY